jgi:DNA-binding LacI/PurR family transcriptional regulator
MPGDVACRDGFAGYLRRVGGTSLTTVSAGFDIPDFQDKITRELARSPKPTAIFATQVQHTQSLFMQLPRLGLKIPDDISILAGESHPLFETSVPELSRYQGATDRTMRHTVRVVQALLAGQTVSAEPFLITPTYIPGKTVARIPVAPAS